MLKKMKGIMKMSTEIAGIIREEEGLLRQEEKHEGQDLGRE